MLATVKWKNRVICQNIRPVSNDRGRMKNICLSRF
jgi:biotin synthase-related radical SAM superfamily protein